MPELTVAQALVRFLAVQHVERDGVRRRLVGGCFGIFGHGNVGGLGQALQQDGGLRLLQGRSEQGMVHAAVGYARERNRLGVLACTTSVGPGATNLVTGAAVATVNRLPVLLLPGDVFATRGPHPVLQQLESPYAGTDSVNDCLRPVSRYWDRITRPEQLMSAALEAMRVLTDPAETGAVTLALPQDVQAELVCVPDDFLAERTWRVRRPPPDPVAVAEAARMIASARRPLIVAGGGVIYSEGAEALTALAEDTGMPVAETQAGKGSLLPLSPQALGGVGATGTLAANRIARTADLVIGIGTRWTDFTTASKTAFAAEGVRFVNVNVAAMDAAKHAGLAVQGDARATLEALREALAGHRVDEPYAQEYAHERDGWNAEVARVGAGDDTPPTQAQLLRVLQAGIDADDVIVAAAGSLPGDLHKLWRCERPGGYHVEYGFSCMGYEIAAAIGVKLASPDRRVLTLVGDASYLMLSSELVTAVQERLALTIVLIDNAGYASIGALSRSLGSDGYGTRYRFRVDDSLGLDSDGDEAELPVDLAANAASLGATVLEADTLAAFAEALDSAAGVDGPAVIHVRADRYAGVGAYEAWWDVPVAEISEMPEVRAARGRYEAARAGQRHHVAADG